jgi:S-adenosylmethionine/arginine decarboxylase-like enzyme
MIGPGTHLMVDGHTMMAFTASYLEQFLRDAVKVVGMTVIMGPVVLGTRHIWDGWVVLAESHAAVHVYGRECHADLFSCQRFDIEAPLEFIRHRLKLSDMNVEVRERPMPEPTHNGGVR